MIPGSRRLRLYPVFPARAGMIRPGQGLVNGGAHVFPARAGMIRNMIPGRAHPLPGVPRSRGDDPLVPTESALPLACSPLARG